jgi:hypothetical protein
MALKLNNVLSAMMPSVANKTIMLSVIVLKVILLSVMAPQVGEPREFWQTTREKIQWRKKIQNYSHFFESP